MLDNFGIKLQRVRIARSLTQKAIASYAGVTTTAISSYERGVVKPSMEVLEKICKKLDVSSDYLMGLSDNELFLHDELTDDQNALVGELIEQFALANRLAEGKKPQENK